MLCLAGNLTGCHASRTPFVAPNINIPAMYTHADVSTGISVDRWWTALSDRNLDDLIGEALETNADLALAALNVRSAQLQVHLALINPTFAAGYTYETSKALNGAGPMAQFHSFTGSASYEIDLWGRLAASRDVAHWEARATEEDRQAAELTVIESAVTLYYEIADASHRITVGEGSMESAKKTLDLILTLKVAGAASPLDVADVQVHLESQRAMQTQLVQRRIELRNALTVLLNGTRWPEARERATIPDEVPPPVTSGIPASLLHRRPDLRAAELRLRENLAQKDVTRLSFYPSLSLTGSLGTASTGLSEVIANPLGSVAAALSLPFLQANQARFATQLARTQYDESVIRFQKTLLRAFYDVDNALSARAQHVIQAGNLERAFQAARSAKRLHEIRYRAGGEPLQLLLAAQEAERDAEIALSANRLARLQDYVTLCTALGGGATVNEP